MTTQKSRSEYCQLQCLKTVKYGIWSQFGKYPLSASTVRCSALNTARTVPQRSAESRGTASVRVELRTLTQTLMNIYITFAVLLCTNNNFWVYDGKRVVAMVFTFGTRSQNMNRPSSQQRAILKSNYNILKRQYSHFSVALHPIEEEYSLVQMNILCRRLIKNRYVYTTIYVTYD